MQELLASRIALTPRPAQLRKAALEVAMLGHCPGPVRLQRLLALRSALDEMRAAGFGDQLDLLQHGGADAALLSLHHLPIPLRSSAEFHDVFPEAVTADTQYNSVLAGRKAWLPRCVDDFFANGGEKLWVISIPEDAGKEGFMPLPDTRLHDVRTLRGLAAALVIPSVATVAFPDLERLQVPAQLPDIPRVRLDNPDPQFLPIGTNTDDDHRERRNDPEMDEIVMPTPLALNNVLKGVLQWVGKFRPDIQCLLTLPLAYNGELDSPGVDKQALDWIREIRKGESRHYLRHMQFVFPYLRGRQFSLLSPVGVIAGKQASLARTYGPWQSMACLPLQTSGRPYPALSLAETIQLRNNPGISVLQQRNKHAGDRVQLDDERLVMPALHRDDYPPNPDEDELKRFDGYRSAEVMRFMGFLQRELNALGEQLVFNLDYRDPRPRLLLEHFFRSLQQRGALRGSTAQEAFHIREILSQEGVMIYEIMVAPAYPIDLIRLTFTNQRGEWKGQIEGGLSDE